MAGGGGGVEGAFNLFRENGKGVSSEMEPGGSYFALVLPALTALIRASTVCSKCSTSIKRWSSLPFQFCLKYTTSQFLNNA